MFGMAKQFVIVLMASFVVTALALAQTPSSSIWPLTADQAPVVTGNLTATNQALNNMQVSYSSSVQRSSPSGTAGSWPGEAVENGTRYMQFAASPKANFDFTVTSASLFLYVNSGSSMKANVYYSIDSTFATKTQLGTTLTLGSSAPSSPNVSAPLNLVVSAGKTFYLRVYPWYTSPTTGKYVVTNSVTISGTTLNATAPLINVAVSDLPKFGAIAVGKSSLAVGYSVSGLNLVADIVITAPAGFEVSKDSTTFASSVSLTPSAGAVSSTTIYARFTPSSAIGTVSDGVINSSTGATSKIVNVEGIAIAQEPANQSTISFGTVTGNSITVKFSGGNGNKRVAVARKDSAVSFLPVDGSGTSGINNDYSAATDQGGGNKVVYSDTGSTVIVTGLASGTKYYFAVFEFNTGEGNSENYIISNPGTGNQSTLSVPGLAASLSTLAFGNVVVNTSSVEKSYSLSGNFLTPVTGAITVAAPSGFLVSKTSGTGFSSSISLSYTGQTLISTLVYVQFNPTSESDYSGTITNSGGGASTISIAVSGKGITQVVPPDSIPFGFASVGTGTTGGAGGATIIITSGQQLADILKLREKTSDPRLPVIFDISGTITFPTDEINIKRTSNVSVLGIGSDAKFSGTGIKMVESSNIIIRNITFSDCTAGEGDGVSVEGCNNVWIDHCSFTDSPSIDLNGDNHDGELDVKKGSYNVTLSWNHMMNHRKTCLMGHSVTETGDVNMKVTYYRNWFDGTNSRHPRVRYGSAHLLNNLYSSVGISGGYGVGITCAANVLVEGNYFENTPIPILISQVNDPEGTLSGDPAGYVKASNNYLSGSGAIVENTSGYNFSPTDFYSYTPGDPQGVKAVVKAGAGAGVLNLPTLIYEPVNSTRPVAFELSQNYPNPFNPVTMISYQLAVNSFVSVRVYDLLGREIATLMDEQKPAGTYTLRWDASNFASGIYFYRLQAGKFSDTKKLLFLK